MFRSLSKVEIVYFEFLIHIFRLMETYAMLRQH